MQTFLPYPSFARSLACLDNKRLGKQRVEAMQILRALEFGPYQYEDTEDLFVHPTSSNWVSCSPEGFRARLGSGRYRRTPWYNHPATKMWLGAEGYLASYGFAACNVWPDRGFKDSMLPWFASRLSAYPVPPVWLHDQAFHLSHQSNLVRKDPAHYRQFFPDVPDNLPYIWPQP